MKKLLTPIFVLVTILTYGQTSQKIYDIIDAVSEERLRQDVKTLADFGTRNTFSDTISDTRGIGAARRWIKSEFESISADCNNCLDVFYQKDFVTKEGNTREAHVVCFFFFIKEVKYLTVSISPDENEGICTLLIFFISLTSKFFKKGFVII